MATNLKIDDKLIKKAMKLGKHLTKKETVSFALEEYIKRREQKKIADLFGKIEYDLDYNYKSQRNRQ